MTENRNHSLKWFKERIGKTVFAIYIIDESIRFSVIDNEIHAQFLFDKQGLLSFADSQEELLNVATPAPEAEIPNIPTTYRAFKMQDWYNAALYKDSGTGHHPNYVKIDTSQNNSNSPNEN